MAKQKIKKVTVNGIEFEKDSKGNIASGGEPTIAHVMGGIRVLFTSTGQWAKLADIHQVFKDAKEEAPKTD